MTQMRLLASALFLGTAGASLALTFTFQHGTNGYAGGRDTYINSAQANSAFGTDIELSIDASDGGGVSQGIIAFDAIFGDGAGQIPLGWTVTKATLKVQVSSAGSGIQVYRMLTEWSEASTWNSLTGGIAADGSDADSTLVSSLGANNGSGNIPSGPLSIDLTTAAQAWAAGAPNQGVALLPFTPDGTNGLDFFTKENPTNRPLLEIEAVPEPATLAALACGLAALAARKRRSR